MRLIAIGALAVAALAVALLLKVTDHSEPASAPSKSVVAPSAPPAPPAPTAPAEPRAPIEDHARSRPAQVSAPSAPALPTASPEVVAKPNRDASPTDLVRWSLMHAVSKSEPAVIDCLDKARAAGTLADGRAVFAFFVTTKNGKPVIDRASVDTSPFPDALNTCLVAALSGGELDHELPEGQNELRVLRELVVEKGTIVKYKLKSFLPP